MRRAKDRQQTTLQQRLTALQRLLPVDADHRPYAFGQVAAIAISDRTIIRRARRQSDVT